MATPKATSTVLSKLNAEGANREQARLNWLQQISVNLTNHLVHLKYIAITSKAILASIELSTDPYALLFSYSPRIPRSVTQKKQKAIQVTLLFNEPFEKSLGLQPICTCSRSQNRFLCEHTYAALIILKAKFSDPKSDLAVAILGEAEPTWAVALRSLDDFLSHKTVDPVLVKDEVKSRLVWRMTPSTFETFSLDPVEQTPGKRGGWNKGKIIRWDQVGRMNHLELGHVDREVIQQGGGQYWGPTTDQIGRLLDNLVGHPLVFFESTPVTVQRAQLGLQLEESGTNWDLVPAIDGRSLKEFPYFSIGNGETGFVCHPTEGQIFVVRASYETWKLAKSLLSEKPQIPPQVQAEFLKRIPALEAKFPVRLPESLRGEFIPAAEHLICRLTPGETSGATVQIQVQPAPGGSFFAPGDGPKEIAGQKDQVRIQVRRDFHDERTRAESLASELFLNRHTSLSQSTWSIAADDDVLDLLDALRARPENDPLVLWPENQTHRQMRVLGEVSPSALRVEVKDKHDWFGLTGSVNLGGVDFPLVALLEALKGGRRYLDLGKGQFAAISKEFRDRLSSVTDMIHSNRGKLEFNATAAPLLAELFNDDVTLKASKKWRDSLKRLQLASDLDPVVPTTLMAELRDYQVDGYKWLRRLAEWGVGGCLADDMGLGKTLQAIAVLLDRRDKGPILVVAPVSVGFNWVREVERFAPTLRPILYRDTDRVEFLQTLEPGDLLITSYHLLQQHVTELSQISWGTLVLDEAQAIKNSQTKTSQAVREIQADWRLALTGTPAENHLGDLWSLFRGVAPGLFGSWERFREVFADPIEKGKDLARKQALSRVIRPFILRRTKSEVLTELPSRTEIQLTAELSKAERRVYEDARMWAVTNLTNIIDGSEKDQRFQVLAALTRLRQLACHPRLVDKTWKLSSAKLDLFLDTVDELREGKHRALVFSQFTQHLALVREALDERKISYQYLDGATPVKKRQQAVDAFQNGEGELFLISLKAGGTGLNLTGADYVVHLDPWWNPAVEDQATDRAHRIGQTRPVTVYRLVAKETIEEQILKLHADKRGLVAGILEGTDAAGKMSTTELVNLIKLGGNAT